MLQQIESGKLVHKSDLSSDDVGELETILNTRLHSFLSVPILHKHQDKTRILKRRRTSSIFYEPENDVSAGDYKTESCYYFAVDNNFLEFNNKSSKSNGVSSETRVREESGPCVALLVCLVNK